MKLSNEVKIGIIVAAGLGMMIWGINFLKGVSIFSDQKTLYAIYDNIDGMQSSNLVQINGMQVGAVKSVEFTPDHSGKILVSFILSNEIPIPKNTIARIVSSNLMGGKAIDLILGDSKDVARSGDTLLSEIQLSLGQEVNRQVAPIKEKAVSMLSSLDSVLMVIQSIFNPETRENLSTSFDRINEALTSLEHASKGIDAMVSSERIRVQEIMKNIESITNNLSENNKNITSILKNFSSISDSLAKANIASTINNANDAMNEFASVMEKVNKGEGSLGLLVNDQQLYNNLTTASKDLDLLIKDLNENPGRYVHVSVFGKKDKKKK